MQVGASVRVPRRCGGLFGTGGLRPGDPAASGFASGVAREAGGGHGGHGPHCVGFGLQLNLAPGKTETVVSWVGPGSRPVRHFRTTCTQRRFHSRRARVMTANCRFGLCQRTTGQCGSFRLIAIWGQSLRQGLATAERWHRGPTPDRRRRMRCRVQAIGGSRNTCVSRWPRYAWPQDVCTKRGRGTFFQRPRLQRWRVARSKPWRIIAGAHRPPPQSQRWKSNEAVQKKLKVGKLEDELACTRLRYVARAARLAPPYVLAMLQSGAAATWRSTVLEDMECRGSQGWRNMPAPASASVGRSGHDGRRSKGLAGM